MDESWTRAFQPILNVGAVPSPKPVPRPMPSKPKQRYGCSIVCFTWKHMNPENDEVCTPCKIDVCKSTLEDLEDLD